jgi:hypothetical protein
MRISSMTAGAASALLPEKIRPSDPSGTAGWLIAIIEAVPEDGKKKRVRTTRFPVASPHDS